MMEICQIIEKMNDKQLMSEKQLDFLLMMYVRMILFKSSRELGISVQLPFSNMVNISSTIYDTCSYPGWEITGLYNLNIDNLTTYGDEEYAKQLSWMNIKDDITTDDEQVSSLWLLLNYAVGSDNADNMIAKILSDYGELNRTDVVLRMLAVLNMGGSDFDVSDFKLFDEEVLLELSWHLSTQLENTYSDTVIYGYVHPSAMCLLADADRVYQEFLEECFSCIENLQEAADCTLKIIKGKRSIAIFISFSDDYDSVWLAASCLLINLIINVIVKIEDKEKIAA